MNRTIKFTVVFSLFIHLAFLWPLLSSAPNKLPTANPAKKDQTVEITLTQAKPKVVPPPVEPQAEDKPPPPKHMEDDIEKANNSDGLAETKGGKPSKAKQKGDNEPKPNPNKNKPLIADNQIEGKAKESGSEDLDNLSNLDEDLDGNNANQVINDEKEEKPRWYNETLLRIREQIDYAWIRPEHTSRITKGTMQFKLDRQGYLLSAWIQTPSGDWALDASLLRAVKGVMRYQIPPNLPPHRRHILFTY
jgi:outer membrane biosynthesis protein TonB